MIGDLDVSIPDVAEPIVGWRCWSVLSAFGMTHAPHHIKMQLAERVLRPDSDLIIPAMLCSPQRGQAWPPRVEWSSRAFRDRSPDSITARCPVCASPPSPSRSSHQGMGCGIYAYKTIENLAWDWGLLGLEKHIHPDLIDDFRRADPLWVWGLCEMWGDVYDHELGYRAQHARVKALVHIDGYGAFDVDQMGRLARVYGVELISLRPEIMERIAESVNWRFQTENLSEMSNQAIVNLLIKELASGAVGWVRSHIKRKTGAR